MERVKLGGYTELVSAAYSLIPSPMHHMIQPQFLCGTNPIFAGLHRYQSTSDRRSYANTWHVTYPHHQIIPARQDRHTTVVVTDVIDDAPWMMERFGYHHPIAMLVHELGHVLDESLHFKHKATPVTAYARTDRYEAFAEAFTAWIIPTYAKSRRSNLAIDNATRALFDRLSEF